MLGREESENQWLHQREYFSLRDEDIYNLQLSKLHLTIPLFFNCKIQGQFFLLISSMAKMQSIQTVIKSTVAKAKILNLCNTDLANTK